LKEGDDVLKNWREEIKRIQTSSSYESAIGGSQITVVCVLVVV